jgi:two-component system heavy metal sensor histidine kinase CusS
VKKNHLKDLIPKHPYQWSITLRLVWIYTLSAFFVLAIATFSLYWIYTNRLENENYQFLENKVLVLQKLLQSKPANESFLKEEIILEPNLYHYYSRILDRDGNTILETPKMNDIVPVSAFGNIYPAENQVIYWVSPKKNHHREKYFLLMSAPAGNNNNRIIQIAKDISAEHSIIEDSRQGLIIILLLGVFGSAALGIIVTHRGLKPLRDITQSTQRVSVVQLKERLNPTTWPKELSKLANSFNEMLDRIEDGVNRLSQFSGDLAHELRTPVNNLMGEAEIALSKPRSNDEYREVIESSIEELERISQMIENLLFLARAESPESVVNFISIPLRQMLDEVSNFYEAAAEEKNVKIKCEGKAHLIADALMLRRALSNLVYNALQHTPAGGTITLSAKVVNDATYILISDNGEGIAPEHVPHLFDRFYRADSARSTKTGGTGLGLAIVKSIMELHKGQVKVESMLGKGTTVTLIFPQLKQS